MEVIEIEAFEKAHNAVEILDAIGNKLQEVRENIEKHLEKNLQALIEKKLEEHFDNSLKKVEKVFREFSDALKETVEKPLKEVSSDKIEVVNVSLGDIEALRLTVAESFEKFTEQVRNAVRDGFVGRAVEDLRKDIEALKGLIEIVQQKQKRDNEEKKEKDEEIYKIINKLKEDMSNLKKSIKRADEIERLSGRVYEIEEKVKLFRSPLVNEGIKQKLEEIENRIKELENVKNSNTIEVFARSEFDDLKKKVEKIEENIDNLSEIDNGTVDIHQIKNMIKREVERMIESKIPVLQDSDFEDVKSRIGRIESGLNSRLDVIENRINSKVGTNELHKIVEKMLSGSKKEMEERIEKVIAHAKKSLESWIRKEVEEMFFEIGLSSSDVKKLKSLLR